MVAFKLNMKEKTDKYTQAKIEQSRERNRVSAKKRRLKEKILENEKDKLFEIAVNENFQLKDKLNFLNKIKILLENEIEKYNCTIISLNDNQNWYLNDFNLEIIDEIMDNELNL